MSYWIELHCDAHLSDECAGQRHDYPMTGCATVEHGRSIVLANAKARGWKRIAGDMHCKACVSALAATRSGSATAQKGCVE